MPRALCGKSSLDHVYSRNARRINAPRKRHSTRGRPRKFTAEDPSYITQRRRIRITRRRSVRGPASFIPVSLTFSCFTAHLFVELEGRILARCVANLETFIIIFYYTIFFYTNYVILFFLYLLRLCYCRSMIFPYNALRYENLICVTAILFISFLCI